MKWTTDAALAGLAVAALAATGCGSDSSDSDAADAASSTTPAPTTDPTDACPTEGEEWEVAKLYIEHNATDADTGVHGLFGGEAWSVLCIRDPAGTGMLIADPLENFDRLSVSDLFFESREPPDDEYPIGQAFADFPAGEYTVAGIDFEGTPRVGVATFTHVVPAEPNITHPELVPDLDDGEPPSVAASGLVVEWEPVDETIDGDPVDITGYQVIITDEEAEDPNGWARPVYDVHVPADQTALGVPDDWLRPGTLYELEVLAIEESGNQTISVGFFRTT